MARVKGREDTFPSSMPRLGRQGGTESDLPFCHTRGGLSRSVLACTLADEGHCQFSFAHDLRDSSHTHHWYQGHFGGAYLSHPCYHGRRRVGTDLRYSCSWSWFTYTLVNRVGSTLLSKCHAGSILLRTVPHERQDPLFHQPQVARRGTGRTSFPHLHMAGGGDLTQIE